MTMLQRSPTYVISLPEKDPIANLLKRVLPAETAYALTRRKNIWLQKTIYSLSRSRPRLVRRLLRRALERQLPEGYDIDRHFTPAYDPWDQRLCAVPDGDLFEAISRGTASVVTDTDRDVHRARHPARLGRRAGGGHHHHRHRPEPRSAFGGIELVVDGAPVELPETLVYKA